LELTDPGDQLALLLLVAVLSPLAAQDYGPPEWNFYKYLIDRQGRVVARFPSRTRPNDPQLIEAIEKLL
jgi:glutathione peroxidase